jgi:hypothetical protein
MYGADFAAADESVERLPSDAADVATALLDVEEAALGGTFRPGLGVLWCVGGCTHVYDCAVAVYTVCMTTQLARQSTARLAVENELSRRLSPDEWHRLRTDAEFVDLCDYPDDEVVAGFCADLVRSWRRERHVDTRAAETAATAHHRGLTAALTATSYVEASQLRSVERFRADHLADGLLEVDAVLGWVRSIAAAEGDGGRGAPTLAVPTVGGFTRPQRVTPGGVLDGLRLLAGEVAEAYRWPGGVADGVAFIVADVVPLTPAVQTSSRGRWVTMTVHVEAAPDEVAAAYRRARAQVHGSRPRSHDDRTLRAVSFVAFRWGQRWEWPKLWRRWNEEHAEEAFTSWRAFRAAVLGAWRAL